MGYVSKNLIPGEQVVYQAKIHWFIFVPGIILFLVGVLLIKFGATISQVQTESDQSIAATLGVAGMFTIPISIYVAIKAFITKVSTELAVTSKRVIAKVGLIRRNTVELNHSKVESFNVEQSIFGRILGFGTLIINGTGGGKTPIPSIDDPLEFRRKAMETIDATQYT